MVTLDPFPSMHVDHFSDLHFSPQSQKPRVQEALGSVARSSSDRRRHHFTPNVQIPKLMKYTIFVTQMCNSTVPIYSSCLRLHSRGSRQIGDYDALRIFRLSLMLNEEVRHVRWPCTASPVSSFAAQRKKCPHLEHPYTDFRQR